MSANGITRITANGADVLARDLELRTAERDAARYLVLRLERMLTRTGGQMSAPDQATLREARALLVECGIIKRVGEELRAPVAPPWADDPPPWMK